MNEATKQKTEEQRRKELCLIADFMGWESYGDGIIYMFPNLYPTYNVDDKENSGTISDKITEAKFDSEWSWLMPVIERLAKTKFSCEDSDGIYLRTFGMVNKETGDFMVRFNWFSLFQSDNLFDTTYAAIIDALEFMHTMNHIKDEDECNCEE